jgi:hypothetical protein
MRKRLIGLATIFSGVLAVAVLGWWFHSRGRIDVIKIGQTTFAANDGRLSIQHPTMAFHHDRWIEWQTIPYDMEKNGMPVELRPPMFAYSRSMELKDGWQRTLIFPLWVTEILFCVWPGMWVKRRVWPKRKRQGQQAPHGAGVGLTPN